MDNFTFVANFTSIPTNQINNLIDGNTCYQWCVNQHLYANYQPIIFVMIALIYMQLIRLVLWWFRDRPMIIAGRELNRANVIHSTIVFTEICIMTTILWTLYIVKYGYN